MPLISQISFYLLYLWVIFSMQIKEVKEHLTVNLPNENTYKLCPKICQSIITYLNVPEFKLKPLIIVNP